MSDLPVDELLTVDQAIAILDATTVNPRTLRLPLLAAQGCRLADDLFADRDYPPFDKSLMDGFALRGCDATAAGVELAVIETIAAGQVGQREIGPGQTAAIMTGAPLPAGADSVIPVERTAPTAHGIIASQAVSIGQSIARAGADAKAGQLLLTKGTLLGPVQLAVAACIGSATVAVFDRPAVAILSTGDELVAIDKTPTGAQIRNSNSIMMHALLTQLGCRVRDLGMVVDDRQEIRAAIEEGLKSDALFVTGGMSMGERDYVPGIFTELGLESPIRKLRIKPGKPFVFATDSNGKMAFGLPGNPVSAFVCTVRLASRILYRLAGGPPDSAIVTGELQTPLSASGPREQYLPAYRDGKLITPVPSSGSSDLFSLARANCLIRRPENAERAAIGDHIHVIGI